MPREFPLARRVGEQIQRELAELVRDELGAPRVQGITITGVDCSRDLSHARVHFSMLSEDPAARSSRSSPSAQRLRRPRSTQLL